MDDILSVREVDGRKLHALRAARALIHVDDKEGYRMESIIAPHRLPRPVEYQPLRRPGPRTAGVISQLLRHEIEKFAESLRT